MEQQTTILDLNDDCLGEICKLLENYDQVEFGLCCQRFEAVFKMFCKAEHSSVTIGDPSDPKHSEGFWEKYFQMAGSFFKHIECHLKVDELITKYCSNVKEIRYIKALVDKSLIDQLKDIQTLQSLRFYNCEIKENIGKSFSGFKNLKIFYIVLCHGKGLKWLCALPTAKLRILKIFECENVSRDFLLKFTEHCANLIKLSFSCNEDYDPMSYSILLKQLSGLKELYVKGCDNNDNIFHALYEYESDQLETLILDYESSYITIISSEFILYMLQKCPKLSFISIEFNQLTTKPNIINQVIKFLDNHALRKKPIKLRLYIEGLTNDYLQTPEYLATKHILELELLDDCEYSYYSSSDFEEYDVI